MATSRSYSRGEETCSKDCRADRNTRAEHSGPVGGTCTRGGRQADIQVQRSGMAEEWCSVGRGAGGGSLQKRESAQESTGLSASEKLGGAFYAQDPFRHVNNTAARGAGCCGSQAD